MNTGTSAKTVSGGTLAGTGTIPGTVTVANVAGSTLRGGTGAGTTGTLTITGALTFGGTSSSLDVTSDGASLSLVSVGTNTITESSGMTVNLLDPMPAGTYTLISKTTAGLPTTLPTLGTNNSGKIAVFHWTSTTGLTVTLTYLALTFTSITPDSGNTGGGTAVTIVGTGFFTGASLGVTLGGNAATGVSVTDSTHIAATTPSHAAGAVWVNITNGDGQFVNTTGAYTYVAPPTFTSITPDSGTTDGGTAVTIIGGNFVSGASLYVTIGGNAATGVSVTDASHIAATTPTGTAGAQYVNITNGNGGTVNASGAYTYGVPNVAITLNQSSIYLPLTAGSTATNQSLGITVSANIPFIVSVADDTGRGSNLGYMGSYTGSAYDAAGPRLASPLGLAGTTNGTTAALTITPPITTGSQLYSGSAAVTNQLLAPNTFTQPAAFSDPHLPTGSTYRIDLVFTIGTS